MRLSALLLALLLPAAGVADPVTLHVDVVNGSDLGDGSEASPLATIEAALGLALAGDEIAVAPGRYVEAVVMKDGVDIVGSGASSSVIEGASPALVCAAARLSGFDIQGPVDCQASARIERNVIRSTLAIEATDDVEVTGNLFLPAPPGSPPSFEALRVAMAADVRIIGNSFFRTPGILLADGAQAEIANNVLVRGQRGIELEAGALAAIRHNDVRDNRLGIIGFATNYVGIPDPTGSDGNLAVDPSFVDAEEEDFRLRADSPLLDAGSNAEPALAADLDGGARILDGDGDLNALIDIGAQEFDPDETLPLDVAIDLRPRKSPNLVKARWLGGEKPSKKKLPIAVLSGADFSAPDEVDPATLRLGDRLAERCRVKDVDRDDRDDLLCKFPVAGGISLGFYPIEVPAACVRGETFGGRPLLGCDEVEIVP